MSNFVEERLDIESKDARASNRSTSWCRSGLLGRPRRDSKTRIYRFDRGTNPIVCTCIRMRLCVGLDRRQRCVWMGPFRPHGWALSLSIAYKPNFISWFLNVYISIYITLVSLYKCWIRVFDEVVCSTIGSSSPFDADGRRRSRTSEGLLWAAELNVTRATRRTFMSGSWMALRNLPRQFFNRLSIGWGLNIRFY